MYDVVKLSQTAFAQKALSDQTLYETILEHRYKFTSVEVVNYNLHQPQTINHVPDQTVLKAWKKDYETMIEQMIYEENPPSFEDIIIRLTELKSNINTLSWSFKKEYPVP